MIYGLFKNSNGDTVAKTCIVNEGKLPEKSGCTLDIVNKAAYDAAVTLAKPKVYDNKRFLASCLQDTGLATILEKLTAKQEARLVTCLNNSALEIVAGLIEQMVAAGIITQDDAAYFANKLEVEENVSLFN